MFGAEFALRFVRELIVGNQMPTTAFTPQPIVSRFGNPFGKHVKVAAFFLFDRADLDARYSELPQPLKTLQLTIFPEGATGSCRKPCLRESCRGTQSVCVALMQAPKNRSTCGREICEPARSDLETVVNSIEVDSYGNYPTL